MTAAMGFGPDLHAVAVCYHLDPAAFAQDLQRIARGAGRPLRGVVVSNNPTRTASGEALSRLMNPTSQTYRTLLFRR